MIQDDILVPGTKRFCPIGNTLHFGHRVATSEVDGNTVVTGRARKPCVHQDEDAISREQQILSSRFQTPEIDTGLPLRVVFRLKLANANRHAQSLLPNHLSNVAFRSPTDFLTLNVQLWCESPYNQPKSSLRHPLSN